MLGFESIPSWGAHSAPSPERDLQAYLSEECRHRYSSLLQNIDSLDTLLLSTASPAEEPPATNEELLTSPDTETLHPSALFPSLAELTLPLPPSSLSPANEPPLANLSERYQQALVAMRANAQAKSLALVYQRILRKLKKTEQHLEESLRATESARNSVEVASAAVSLCITEKFPSQSAAIVEAAESVEEAMPALPVVTVHPHHLKWEAVDIRIPAGGMITIPIPVPILPQTSPSDSQVGVLPSPLSRHSSPSPSRSPSSPSQLLILSKELSVSWAIRSPSVSYAQIAISAPALKGTPFPSRGAPRCLPLKSHSLSTEELSRRGLQFGYVKSSAEDLLHRLGEEVVVGDHLIQTGDGNRLLEISNRAVWASITLSYQVQIQNHVTEALPPLPPLLLDTLTHERQAKRDSQRESERMRETEREKEAQSREAYLARLAVLQRDLAVKQESLSSLQQRQETLQNRLQSLTGPLLLLRETFKTGVYLREKLCAQWLHWKTLQEVFEQHQGSEEEGRPRLQDSVATDSSSPVPPSFEQQSESLWLQDLALIQQVVESHHELQPLPLAQIFPPPGTSSPFTLPRSVSWLSSTGEDPPLNRPTSPRVEEVTAEEEGGALSSPNPPLRSTSVSPPLSPPLPLLPERILLSSSNLKIRPSCDFRCPLKIPRHPSRPLLTCTLSWDFTLLTLTGQDSSSSASEKGSGGSSIDIGFCVLGKTSGGFFPLLTPYR
jgi:hypothetical protein